MAKTKQRRGSVAKKLASKPLTKKVVSRRATTKSKVNRVKSPKAKRANTTKKTSGYSKGIPYTLLKVAYNGIGSEFVFSVTNLNGKVTSQFHISGDNILQSMGMPIMVLPST